MDNSYIILSNSLPIEERGYSAQTSHKLVKLLPLGLVRSTKGNFLVDNESFDSIHCKFAERQVQIPIDYEHQTLKDMQAPAAGWIKDIVLKSDGIYGAVDWTERAAEYLKNGEYKYLSPVVNVRKTDKKAMELHSAALTNTPAIDAMTPIANSNKPNEGYAELNKTDGNNGSGLAALAALLDLDTSATVEDIYHAVSAMVESWKRVVCMTNFSRTFELLGLSAEDIAKYGNI